MTRTHNRTAYWSEQYRRVQRHRQINAILKQYYAVGIMTRLQARTVLLGDPT